MNRGSSRFAPRARTQQDKFTDCILFIANAMPARLLETTAEKLCDDKGLTDRARRRDVEFRLLTAQKKERDR